jgi:hypothetical protein
MAIAIVNHVETCIIFMMISHDYSRVIIGRIRYPHPVIRVSPGKERTITETTIFDILLGVSANNSFPALFVTAAV